MLANGSIWDWTRTATRSSNGRAEAATLSQILCKHPNRARPSENDLRRQRPCPQTPCLQYNTGGDGCQGRRQGRRSSERRVQRRADPWPPAPAVLFGHASGKVDRQLRMDHAPVLPPSRPLFRDVHHRQIQHFQQAVICWKHRFGPGHLAQLAVETLYGVGGIDQPAHLLR